jgi:hypothetical protein
MKHTKWLLICFSALTTSLFSQDFSLKLSIVNSEISKIEPILYDLEFENRGELMKQIKAPWSYDINPYLEYYDKVSKEWTFLRGSTISNDHRFSSNLKVFSARRPFFIKSKEKLQKRLGYFPIKGEYISSEYYFNLEGQVKIRAVMRLEEVKDGGLTIIKKDTIYSNEANLYITNYSGEDSLALNYLESLSVPHFIYDVFISYGQEGFFLSNSMIKEAMYLIETYPNSKFTVWAYLYLVWENLSYIKETTDMLDEKKYALAEAEVIIKKALQKRDDVSISYIKELYYNIENLKLLLGVYTDHYEVVKANEAIDNL